METVEIFVPHDAGFACGGSGLGVFGSMLMGLVSGLIFFFRCLITPFDVYNEVSQNRKTTKEALLRRKKWEEKNVKSGKNPDGSFTKTFPSSVTLREALTQCGLCIESEERMGRSYIKQFGEVPLKELTKKQIDDAVMSCQIAEW